MTKLEIKKEKSEDWKKRGDWYMFHKIKKTSPPTPLPERGE